MAKVHLYGEEFEVYDTETQVRVEKGALISSPAKAFLLQSPDRKEAIVAMIGSGGETYVLPGKATRVPDDVAEHLVAQLTVIDAIK